MGFDMATIAAVSSIAGGVVSAVSSMQQASYQEDLGRYNARIQENQATQARNAAIEAERDARLRTAALVSQQQAALAAKGVDIGAGSSLELTGDTEILGNIDAFRIRQNADQQVESLLQGANLSRIDAANRASASRSKAFGSLLTSAGKVASSWNTLAKSSASSLSAPTGPRADLNLSRVRDIGSIA